MANNTELPGVGSLVITVTDAEFTNSGDNKLVFSSEPPIALNEDNNKTITPTTGSLAFTPSTPSRSVGLLFVGYAPALLTNHIAVPGVASLLFDGKQLQLLEQPPKKVAPDTGSLGLVGTVPQASIGLPVSAGAMALTGAAPSAQIDTVVNLPVFILFPRAESEQRLLITSFPPIVTVEFVGGQPGDGIIIRNTDATFVKSNYDICDRTGFKIKPFKNPLVEDPYGNYVRAESSDKTRHPQERVKSTSEDYRTGALRPEPVGDETFIDNDDPVIADDY